MYCKTVREKGPISYKMVLMPEFYCIILQTQRKIRHHIIESSMLNHKLNCLPLMGSKFTLPNMTLMNERLCSMKVGVVSCT
jgi:hypothetical protein